jgi:putative transposase
MKKRFTGEQILDFLKQAEAEVPVKELYRRRVFWTRFAGARG